MKSSFLTTAAVGALLATGLSTAAAAEDLTLCWAAWDPANALIELSKRTSRSKSGHTMNFEFVPWTELCRRGC
jgi:multiple sugar transport system substrate-binding protein